MLRPLKATLFFRFKQQNCEKIEELINKQKILPDVISIPETKLNSKNTTNINISNYNFLHWDSPTNAVGVGMYIKDILKYKIRNNFNLNFDQCEDIWIEFQSLHYQPNVDIQILICKHFSMNKKT